MISRVLTLHTRDHDPAPLEDQLRTLDIESDTRELDENAFAEATARSEMELVFWWIHELSVALLAELETLEDMAGTPPVILVLPRPAADSILEAMRRGCDDLLDADRLDGELVPAVQRAMRRHAQAQRHRLAMQLTASDNGFQQGSARLLHDLNSPLTASQNALELVENDYAREDEPLPKKLQMLENGLETARGIARHWQDALYSGEEPQQRVNLGEVVRRVADLLHHRYPRVQFTALPESLHPESNRRAASFPVRALEFELEQALHEVLLNAVEAAENGDREPRVHIALESGERELTMRIEDSGPGVPDEVRQTLWKDFVTTRPNRKGLGIGRVRFLLMQNTGSIALGTPKELGGACFVLTFRRNPA